MIPRQYVNKCYSVNLAKENIFSWYHFIIEIYAIFMMHLWVFLELVSIEIDFDPVLTLQTHPNMEQVLMYQVVPRINFINELIILMDYLY